MELQGKKINFLGDSITEGACLTDPENVYWKRVGRETGATVRGYGIGGTRIAPRTAPEKPGEEGFGQYFGSRVAKMDPDADIVVIFGGTNDFGHGDAPLGAIGDKDNSTFCGALYCLCRDICEKYPRATIMMMTPLHCSGEYDPNAPHGAPHLVPTLAQVVEAERQMASYLGLPVLDLYTFSGLNPALPHQQELYMPDGVHPNDDGHARIASRLVGFLKSL